MSEKNIQFSKRCRQLTMAAEVVICVPPDAPTNIFTIPLLSTIIDGHMEDIGRLPGLIRFAVDGATPK